MATIQLPPDFLEFLRLLTSEKVEYLLIGGHAVAYHGYARNTGDLDIWVAANAENAARIVNALERFGFTPGTIASELFATKQKVFRVGVPPLRIDVITVVSGLEFAPAYEHRVMVAVEDVLVPVISLTDLRTNKQASGRGKDLLDLENLA